MRVWLSILLLLSPLLLAACGERAAETGAAPAVTLAEGDAEVRSGSTTTPPVAAADEPSRRLAGDPPPFTEPTYWPPAALDGGEARLSCEYDYAAKGDGAALSTLEFFGLAEALEPCRERGLVRVRYEGRIDAGFAALVQRVAEVADRMGIATRILDLDSAGGLVEEAIKAGDRIAESNWTVWVRRDSQCHSACMLILAAGDLRTVDGKVGIHRLMRDRSTATTRAELRAELTEISGQLRDYLARNGTAVTLADLMMTVPNRSLRLLRPEELELYGLQGSNPAEDDLNRIRLARKCGDDFARRRDAFQRAFDEQCMAAGRAFGAMDECGMALQGEFGFPDAKCPNDGPLAAIPQVTRQAASAPAPRSETSR